LSKLLNPNQLNPLDKEVVGEDQEDKKNYE
jgi:hypothetical protein